MGCLKGWRRRKERFETKIGQAGKKEKKVKKEYGKGRKGRVGEESKG